MRAQCGTVRVNMQADWWLAKCADPASLPLMMNGIVSMSRGWKSLSLGALLSLTCLTCVDAGSEKGADRIKKEHRLEVLLWKKKLKECKTYEARLKAMEEAPNNAAFGARMVSEIAGDLSQEWTLPYAGWVLMNHPKVKAADAKALFAHAETYHMNSPKLGQFCLSAMSAPSPLFDKINFVEKVLKQTPHNKVKGEASLALSIMLGGMGDDREILARRLNLLRTAISEAYDVPFGKVTVGSIAAEELYRIKHLSKGRVAPPLTGKDSAGRAFSLEQEKGKAVVLVFWASSDKEAVRTLRVMKQAESHFAGKPVTVVGVNRDSLANLRKMEQAGVTVQKNLSDASGKVFKQYRVSASPWCYVIDKEGVIQYTGAPGSFADLTVEALLVK